MPYIVIGGVLYHYGIPGMEWGKRRFQNKDGSLTEAGKRRYAKAIRRYSKIGGTGTVSKAVAEDIEANNLLTGLGPTVKSATEALSRYRALRDKQDEFYTSGEFARVYEEAAQDTLEFFKTNRPDELADMVKKNGGSENRLWELDEFAERIDWYERTEAAKNAWNNANGVTDESLSKAWSEYTTSCRAITDALVGKYGDMKIDLSSSEDVKDRMLYIVDYLSDIHVKGTDRSD